MLHAIPGRPGEPPIWLDLDRATSAEIGDVARQTGLRVPTLAQVAEIEASSRLAVEDGTLYLTAPMLSRSAGGTLTVAPIGFVVAPDRLLTVRFAESALVDHFAQTWRAPNAPASGMQPFLALLEAMVDRLADVLEQLSGEMDSLSAALFRNCPTGRLSGRRRTLSCRTRSPPSAAKAPTSPSCATACSASAASCATCTRRSPGPPKKTHTG